MTQVISLELSKELYQKGLRIETEKWWNNLNSWQVVSKRCNNDIIQRNEERGVKIENYPAPSTDELFAVMPVDVIVHKKDTVFIVNYKEIKQGKWNYIANEFDIFIPEALGKMCFWLLNNGYHYNPETKMIERL